MAGLEGGSEGEEALEELELESARGTFTRDLVPMMFGYGDDAEPFEESVELMEDLLIDYVTDLAHLCMRTSVNPGRLQMEDVLFLLRKDEKKFARCKELLETSVELKKTMKAFNSQDLEMKKKRQLELEAAATEQRRGAAGGAAGGAGGDAAKT